jgi:hypothetical protein
VNLRSGSFCLISTLLLCAAVVAPNPRPAAAQASRKITLSYSADDDLGIEWGFIQQETRKTNVPVSVAYDMAPLREVQTEFVIQ